MLLNVNGLKNEDKSILFLLCIYNFKATNTLINI